MKTENYFCRALLTILLPIQLINAQNPIIGDFNVDDGGINKDLRIRLHQKAAIGSYNTQTTPNDILFINRDWESGTGYHSDFNKVRIFNGEAIGDFNLFDDGINKDMRFRINSKAAIGSYNTQTTPNDILFINRDWETGIGYHSDFNKVRIFNGEAVGDFNLFDDGINKDMRFRINSKAAIGSYNTQTTPNDVLYINRDWESSTGYHSDFNKVSIYGSVGIGTDCPKYDLDVIGTIRAKEIKVDSQGGCDFVFKNDYKLMDLKELETFIITNQHLPEIDSEKEMIENGVNLKDLQMKLLQKIEELTLYTIQQNKRIEKLENENFELKEKIKNNP